VDDWIKGFTVLTAYKAGTYTPGMEKNLEVAATSDLDTLARRIIADYSTIKGVEERNPEIKEPTFAEVYERFYKWKFEDDQSRTYAKSSRDAYKTAFGNCSSLYDRTFSGLKHEDLQNVINSCPLKHASLELILMLFKQMYKYALIYEICTEDKSIYVKINKPDDDESGIPFDEKELKTLWQHKDEDDVAMILIMCYSGFRISAYKTLEVNLTENYFKGGVKTKAGKNRVVPIHSSIQPLVSSKISRHGSLIPCTVKNFRDNIFVSCLKRLGISGTPKHTPHDCRHTFSMLCEKYAVRENDRKRMLGHAFSDITNDVYGHRNLDDLRAEIEKIQVPML
jgi:integrase